MAKKPVRKFSSPARKIFLIDNEGAFSEELEHKIDAEKNLAICGIAKNLSDAFREITRLHPDLVVANVRLLGKHAFELIKKLRAKYGNSKIRLLVISRHADPGYANRALRAGADGYILQREDPEEIICAIRDVLAGHIYVSEEIMVQSNVARGSAKAGERPKASLKIGARITRSASTQDGVGLRKRQNQSTQASAPDWKSSIAV